MSEDKIMNIIKGKLLMIEKMLKQDDKEGHTSTYEMQFEDFEAIQGLLDLYKKEKEKREITEENYKVLSLDLGDALKDLGLPEDTIIADELVLEINKKYISKDKILQLIQKKQDRIDKLHPASDCVIIDDLENQIEVLKELLGEQNII